MKKIYFAPLEGITGYIFRNAHNACFGGIDKYFTPFIVPTQKKVFRTRERNDVLPEHNEGICLVPQILTNNSERFLEAANTLYQMGYTEVNLNLGCPSGTVVAKKKGSGFLAFPTMLDAFLDEVFQGKPEGMELSIKTRIGKDDPEEFPEILEIYNKYPLSELIIHPRIQKDYYKNTPNLEMFHYAVAHTEHALCYNGDIFTKEDYDNLIKKEETVDGVMLGRGIIANPSLAGTIRENKTLEIPTLERFHNQVYEGYCDVLKASGEHTIYLRMKEIWFYMLPMFEQQEMYSKQMKKVRRVAEYESLTRRIFREGVLRKEIN